MRLMKACERHALPTPSLTASGETQFKTLSPSCFPLIRQNERPSICDRLLPPLPRHAVSSRLSSLSLCRLQHPPTVRPFICFSLSSTTSISCKLKRKGRGESDRDSLLEREESERREKKGLESIASATLRSPHPRIASEDLKPTTIGESH